jgi:predicted secreted protein
MGLWGDAMNRPTPTPEQLGAELARVIHGMAKGFREESARLAELDNQAEADERQALQKSTAEAEAQVDRMGQEIHRLETLLVESAKSVEWWTARAGLWMDKAEKAVATCQNGEKAERERIIATLSAGVKAFRETFPDGTKVLDWNTATGTLTVSEAFLRAVLEPKP